MVALRNVDYYTHPATIDSCSCSVCLGAPCLTTTGKNGCLTHKQILAGLTTLFFAEHEGFEPPVVSRPHLFSKQAPSASRTMLQYYASPFTAAAALRATSAQQMYSSRGKSSTAESSAAKCSRSALAAASTLGSVVALVSVFSVIYQVYLR